MESTSKISELPAATVTDILQRTIPSARDITHEGSIEVLNINAIGLE